MMKEKILIVNNVNGTELLRTLARFGSGQFLLRVFNTVELATESLVRSGKALKESFLSRNDEVYIMDSFIKESPYFKVSSFSDSENLANTMYALRMMVTVDEEDTIRRKLRDGEFLDKNKAISKIYLKYVTYLKDNCLIDSIGIIRRALESSDKMDREFIMLKEYPLEPLEKELVTHLSDDVKEMSILDLFGREEKPLKIDDYVSAYGTVNELGDLLSHIYENKIPFDKCQIVTPKNSYNQFIYNFSINMDIPVTYAGGLSINNASAFGILKLLLRHRDNEYGVDTLRDLLFSNLLNRKKLLEDIGAGEDELEDIVNIAGNLKISFNEEINDERYTNYEPNGLKDWRRKDYNDPTKKLKGIFNEGIVSFLNEYSLIRSKVDADGLNFICRNIAEYTEKVSSDIGELFPVLNNKYISKEVSQEGYLHVCDITSAPSCLRENIFIVGLSSANFPGLPRENYLLLDSDIVKFREDGHTSDRIIAEKTERLSDLLRIASSLDCHISVSYSDFNIAGLKSDNPSSFIFDLYQKETGDNDYDSFKKCFRKTSYFEHMLKKDERLGQAYIEGKEIISPKMNSNDDKALPSIDKYFSPTQIETYFNCPRQFYINFVLGIKEVEEDDPYQIISAKDTGDLYHKLMEHKANKGISEEDFLKLADELFKDYMTTRPEIHEDAKERAREEFLEMCATGYLKDPSYHVEAAEQYQKSECYGVKLKGFPDRIEKDNDGNYLIADFKTGRRIKHDPSDPLSCLQVLLYAYMSEKELGLDIKYCQYRYPRFGYTVTCAYDDENKDKLSTYMTQFRNALEEGKFPCADEDKQKKACLYCRYGSICGKQDKGAQDD